MVPILKIQEQMAELGLTENDIMAIYGGNDGHVSVMFDVFCVVFSGANAETERINGGIHWNVYHDEIRWSSFQPGRSIATMSSAIVPALEVSDANN